MGNFYDHKIKTKRFSKLSDAFHEIELVEYPKNVVILPPNTGDGGDIPSDEENNVQNNITDQLLPLEIAGDVELDFEVDDSDDDGNYVEIGLTEIFIDKQIIDIDDNEQYSRRHSLRLYGIEKKEV